MKTSVESSRRSDSADASRAPFRSASFAWPSRSVSETPTGAEPRRAGEFDSRRALAEANQLRVVSCAGREPLRGDVQRLEQVRLAGAVSTDHEDDPLREVEVERRVRPVLTERYVIADQPASLIGMIRYT